MLELMTTLGVPVRAYKTGAAWVGERAARLKLNGYLVTRSPLSSLEELEMLRLGVEWQAGCRFRRGRHRRHRCTAQAHRDR